MLFQKIKYGKSISNVKIYFESTAVKSTFGEEYFLNDNCHQERKKKNKEIP